jgi:hypothetical protein
MANAGIMKKSLSEAGFTVFGGENAPYIWVKTPNGMKSWEFFDQLLMKPMSSEHPVQVSAPRRRLFPVFGLCQPRKCAGSHGKNSRACNPLEKNKRIPSAEG